MSYASLSVSSIAWPATETHAALNLLAGLGLRGVEIAPFDIFGRWEGVADEARRLRDSIERHGLACTALQGILYNKPGVELFASEQSRSRLARHLEGVAEIAGILGARACVFGAPRQRDPGDLPPDRAWALAVEFLRDVGPTFAARGSKLTFEANAARYSCRFVTTTAEAVRLVEETASPGIGLQIDTSTLFLEREDPAVLLGAARVAAHAHISEPFLAPIGAASVDHTPVAAALRASNFAGSLSIEMRAVENWRAAVSRAVDFVRSTYF